MGDVAAMHYIVERIESDPLTGDRNMAWRAAGPLVRGGPLFMPRMPDPSRPLVLHEADPGEIRRNAKGDMIRIMDRESKCSEILDDVWQPSSDAGGVREGDIGWGDPGQR